MNPDPWSALAAELERWSGAPALLWWRDDDAVSAGRALDKLLAVRTECNLPIALACVPAMAETSLARALDEMPVVRTLAHGWDHRNHAPPGAPSAELAHGRDSRQVLTELATGRDRLAQLFGDKFLPVLVPPYNRVDAALVPVIRRAGFTALSVEGDFTSYGMLSRNVHVDVTDWRIGTATGTASALRRLVGALRLRRIGIINRSVPIGILTHHLVHDAASWKLTSEILRQLIACKSVIFPQIEEIFAP
jgi:peptidoglycan/xylan/chitin deacetylase (PgdA/CDA1 family)